MYETRGHEKLRLSRWNFDKIDDKMYELINIFPIWLGFRKKAAKGHFLFSLDSQKGLYVLDYHSKGNA